MFSNMGLQKRISLLVLAGLAVGLSLFSWVGIKSLSESTERILAERLTVARIMATALDEKFWHLMFHMSSSANLASNPGDTSPEDFQRQADHLSKELSESELTVRSIILTDRTGVVIRDAPGNKLLGVNLLLYSGVGRAFELGRPMVSNLTELPGVDKQVILLGSPVFDNNGEIKGLMVAAIEVESSNLHPFSDMVSAGNTGYTEVVDGNGMVLARTEPGLPARPAEKSDHPGRFAQLIADGEAKVRTCHRCHESASQTVQRSRDVLAFAPLSAASWGVAIRQSEEEALAPTRQLQARLLLMGALVLLVTFLIAWIVLQGVVRPMRMLTAAANRVAAGFFKTALPVKRRDEIGQLGSAFYAMTQELAKSRDELVARNDELSALNSIAATVGQSLELKDVLETSLQKVLEVTRTSAGCVFLSEADSNKLQMMNCIGLTGIFRCQEASSTTAYCACHQVLARGETMMVNDVSQCSKLDDPQVKAEKIGSFVCVPLKSRNRTLGIINIACSGDRYFTENDFKLLGSIGQHVGLAVENSVLYREVKAKEELRGQLLSSVISAQEDERKRIARELHDEYGQILTGLMMSMESLESSIGPSQPQVRERLENAKALVVRALQDIRRLTLDLRPYTLDYLGLVATIRSYAQTRLEPLGINVDFHAVGLSKRLAPAIETGLFRILQESITNVIKYAEARNVSIRLESRGGKIIAIVEDDGKGFDVQTVIKNRNERQSLGLLGMEERAALLGGSVSVKSKAGHGTRIAVEIPQIDAVGAPGPVEAEAGVGLLNTMNEKEQAV